MRIESSDPLRSVLITGVSGLVGSAVFRDIESRAGRVTGLYRAHPFRAEGGGRFHAADLRDAGELRAVLDGSNPSLVVNCAACPDIAPCEADPAATRRLNTDAPLLMAAWCREKGARFVHISTDQVYDGARGGYGESDPPSPVHEYGRGKADAEEGVLSANPDAVVVRISLVVGTSWLGTRSASESFAAQVASGAVMHLYTNEIRTPVLVDDVARAVRFLGSGNFAGLINVAGPDRVNRLELGRALAARFGLPDGGLLPGLSEGLAARPPRPLDLSLDTSLAARVLPDPPRGLREALAALPDRST